MAPPFQKHTMNELVEAKKLSKLYDAKDAVFNDPVILNADVIGEDKDTLVNKSTSPREINKISDKMFCTLCRCDFETQTTQREHYKLDWHLFNLKRKFNYGLEALSEEDFENLTDEISSISGSDSDDSSEDSKISDSPLPSKSNSPEEKISIKRKFPKIFFKNTDGDVFAVYRCVVHGKLNEPENGEEMAKMIHKLHGAHHKWCILMTGGGHFAGAIFYREEVQVHKTFHRYTVRAKRGTSQGIHDAQHGHSKSAGANLRRYNEVALREEIYELLKSWRDDIKTCERIFIRAPGYDKSIFFSGKDPSLVKHDPRIRSIPFATRRPTFKEVNRVHQELNTIFCYENEMEAFGSLSRCSEKENTHGGKTSSVPNVKPENQDIPLGAESQTNVNSKEPIDENILDKSSSSSSSGSGSEDIEMVKMSVSTLHLKEFDSTKGNPRQRKKRSKRAHGSRTSTGTQPSKPPPLQTIDTDSEMFFLCHKLYTASRSGDTDTLRSLLTPLLGTSTAQLLIPNQNISSAAESFTTGHTSTIGDAASAATATTDRGQQPTSDATAAGAAKAATDTSELPTGSHAASTATDTDTSKQHPLGSIASTASATDMRERPTEQVTVDMLNSRTLFGGKTLLHVAARSGQPSAVLLLLEAGCIPSIRDEHEQTAYAISCNKLTRNAFRKFMAMFPTKYNYSEAQIPGPLTKEMEEKLAEKTATRKQAKRLKNKGKKAEQKKKDEEDKEKQWFLSLSDREKRALAAERRFSQQRANLKRCWICGESLEGKTPFEYLDFKFCSLECLRKHKEKQKKDNKH